MWDGQAFARDYRAWLADGAPGVDPIVLSSADHECEHDTCPTDRVRRCDCFGRTAPDLPVPVPVPDLRTEADRMTPEEAPFGRKADGTPRKRPAPTPERIEKMRAARGKKAKKKAAPKPVPSKDTNAKGGQDFFERMVADFDAELERIAAGRQAFIEAMGT